MYLKLVILAFFQLISLVCDNFNFLLFNSLSVLFLLLRANFSFSSTF